MVKLFFILLFSVGFFINTTIVTQSESALRPRSEYRVFFAGGEERVVYALDFGEALKFIDKDYSKLGKIYSVSENRYVRSEWIGYEESK